LRTAPAKLALIAHTLFAGGWPTWLAFVSAAGLSAFIWIGADPSLLAGAVDSVKARSASLLTFLVAATTAVGGAYKFVRPMFEGVAAFTKDLAEEKKRRGEQLKRAQDELAGIQNELKRARGEAETGVKNLSPYENFDKGRGHGTILRYFLYEDSDTKEYEKHIGLVSRARRTFQKLDEIIRAQRQTPQKKQKLTVPDRIVLYIDDLDRCRYEQVVRVLEAVHLLLAFESIVVVVGVDARWIRAALAKYYQGEFVTEQDKSAQVDANGGRRPATPEDYLQKIFQIPFWLQPFRSDRPPGYSKFVAALARGRMEVEKPVNSGNSEQKASTADSKVASASGGRPLAAAATAIVTAVERVTLTEPEVAVLSALAPLAGDTPRAVKRFVNLYRLIRARQRDADFDKFVGQAGYDPRYPGVALLLALETGSRRRSSKSLTRRLPVGPTPICSLPSWR
jgi:KAP family P-loop domain